MKTVSSRESFLHEVLFIIGSNCNAIELGVYNGDFSTMMYGILRPYELTLVDPFELGEQKYKDGLTTAYSTEDNYQVVLKKFEDEKYVVIDKRLSFDAVNDYKDGEFDFIYIDACHLYECVKRDLNDWLPKLRKGGVIGLHDYANISDFGVIEAVDEFCIKHGFEKIIYNINGHDVALKQK
jgi:hypothetical protein